MEQAVESNDTLQTEGTESLLQSATQLGENEYWLGEGYKAEGEIPEWYKADKYKTVADQAKAYVELEKRFGSFKGAPKEGYTPPEGVEPDDYLFQQLAEFGKETNMAPEAFEKAWQLLSAQSQAAEEVNQEAELAKLGDNAGQRINQLDRALRASVAPEKYDAIKGLIYNADSVILAEEIMRAMQPQKLPIDGAVQPGGMTWADIEKEMFRRDDRGNLLRSIDSNHERKIQQMMKEFGGDRPYQRTVG